MISANNIDFYYGDFHALKSIDMDIEANTVTAFIGPSGYFLPKLPNSVFDQVMALPYHLYVIATSGTDIEASRPIAYGTALVLISIVLLMNLLATALRRYFGKKVKMN